MFQDRLIENLKDQKERALEEKHGEMEACKKENMDLKDKIVSLQAQIMEKEVKRLQCKNILFPVNIYKGILHDHIFQVVHYGHPWQATIIHRTLLFPVHYLSALTLLHLVFLHSN